MADDNRTQAEIDAANEAIWDAWAEGERQAHEAYEKAREAQAKATADRKKREAA